MAKVDPVFNCENMLTGLLIGFAGSYILRFRPSQVIAFTRSCAEVIHAQNSMKLVFVVRTDLGMSKGKIASQCAHAAVCCYQQAMYSSPDALKLWEMMGQPKMVLKPNADGEQHLIELNTRAKSAGLISYLVRDAGRTQIDRGTVTVVGIGPGKAAIIDQITGQLKLL